MARLFHPSVEGAQHGAKGLAGFLEFARKAEAEGCQPSNFMLEGPDGGFKPSKEIMEAFEAAGLKLDGVSAHCPFWVQTTAWTGSLTMRPFLPKSMVRASLDKIEGWAEDYILRLLDLCAELKIGVVPMFWGMAFGWEVGTGYPWGFWKGPGYDLVSDGCDRFAEKTKKIRDHARKLGIVLAHEIHPGTAAVCAHDFLKLVEICDGDAVLGANADPSHCWEGESWQTRFDMLAGRVYGCHVKNHHVRPGMPLRCMIPDWPNRPMQFTALDHGDIDLIRYAEQMIRIGYPKAYMGQMGAADTAPLVVEAEGAFQDLDEISANGIRWVADNLCFEVAAGSFEDGMGA